LDGIRVYTFFHTAGYESQVEMTEMIHTAGYESQVEMTKYVETMTIEVESQGMSGLEGQVAAMYVEMTMTEGESRGLEGQVKMTMAEVSGEYVREALHAIGKVAVKFAMIEAQESGEYVLEALHAIGKEAVMLVMYVSEFLIGSCVQERRVLPRLGPTGSSELVRARMPISVGAVRCGSLGRLGCDLGSTPLIALYNS